MATKRRNKQYRPRGARFMEHFISRCQDLGEHHASIMLTIRLMREVLAEREGDAQTWVEIAAVFNVCAMYAQHKKRQDWFDALNHAADGLRQVEQRVRRVGGRYAASQAELDLITPGLNLIDQTILPQMTALEWNHFALKAKEMFESYQRQHEENDRLARLAA